MLTSAAHIALGIKRSTPVGIVALGVTEVQ